MRVILPVLVVLLGSGGAYAYGGGGGGGSSCAEPKFFEPNPVGPVPSLTEFSFIASDNTDIASLTVEINGEKTQPAIQPRRSGDFEVKVLFPQAITTPGKVRIGINARGKEGCWGFQPYFVEVKP